jgi:chromosome segregation ATPase
MRFPKFALAALAAGLLSQQQGLAQASPSKPNSKQTPSKGLMTRDELRQCLYRQEGTATKAKAFEQRKSALATDKSELAAVIDAAKVLREEVNKQIDLLQQIDLEVRDHTTRIEKWNSDLKEASESQERSAERRKKELLSEQDGLNASSKALNAKRTEAFTHYQETANQFKERGTVVDADIANWNQRSKQLAADLEQASEVQRQYAADCTNRRFLEADETAIRNGK